MTYFNKNQKTINGPINVIRLEGKINNISKVIYLFLDQHYELNKQTECDNVFSIDVNTYFADSFLKLNEQNRKYDFFLEILPSALENVSHGFTYDTTVNNRLIYIHEVLKLFRKIFQFNPKKNRVSISQKFKNLRLHYMDVRDYFEQGQYENLSKLSMISDDFASNNRINGSDLKYIISGLIDFKQHCEKLYSIINKTPNPSKKKNTIIKYGKYIDDSEFTQSQIYLIHKMFNRFNNLNVKKILGKQKKVLTDNLSQLIDDTEYLSRECNNILSKVIESNNNLTKDNTYGIEYTYGLSFHMTNKMIFFIRDHLNILMDKFTFFYTRFADVFFLRRFLDKEYITNAITYTGSYHSQVYIEILSQEFDFKITHFAYSKISDLKKLNIKVRKIPANEMGEIFYPPIRSQCSDITNFPPNFT